MGRQTVRKRKDILDQFYTSEAVAKDCFSKVIGIYGDIFDLYLEPSAGAGSFYDSFPKNKRFGMDLDPKHPEIVQEDFFKFNGPAGQNVAIIGNPPFGRNAGLAVRFFNHAASFKNVSVIAFIVPKTFRKESIHNRLSLDFVLKTDMGLPRKAFIFLSKEYDLPSCFQIWERSRTPRKRNIYSGHNRLFVFVSKKDADLAVRRVGGRAGNATLDVSNKPTQSFYFLKIKNESMTPSELVQIINSADFSDTVNSTAGVRSLSKPELLTKLRSLPLLQGVL